MATLSYPTPKEARGKIKQMYNWSDEQLNDYLLNIDQRLTALEGQNNDVQKMHISTTEPQIGNVSNSYIGSTEPQSLLSNTEEAKVRESHKSINWENVPTAFSSRPPELIRCTHRYKLFLDPKKEAEAKVLAVLERKLGDLEDFNVEIAEAIVEVFVDKNLQK